MSSRHPTIVVPAKTRVTVNKELPAQAPAYRAADTHSMTVC